MPKKIVEPILGVGRDPESNLIVQKSLPLFSLWQSDMSLAEFKILDTYLSRINSREPDKRTVVFTKGELEQLLEVKKINKPQLAARLKNLGRFVDIADGNSRKVHQIALFEEAYGELDENGQWTVRLTCTAKAMKYIFNVDKLGYLRYRLHSIISLKSRYAYILFLFLEHNRYRKAFEVSIEELRQRLNCAEEFYNEFKYFNQRILQRCQTEIHEKTECRFTYEPIKTGRRVTAVRFTIESIAVAPVPIAVDGQLSLFGESADPIDAVAAVLPATFTRDQVQAVCTAAVPVAAGLYGVATPTPAQVMGYLQTKMGLLMAYDAKEPIPHKDRYLLRMIENDLAKVAAMPKANPSSQRELDEDEIAAIQRMLEEPDPPTAADDPDLAARAETLRESLKN